MSSSASRLLFSKFTAWILLGLVGCYVLFPNLLKRSTENRFALGNINLGIDLKGGTYITLGVDIQKAVDNYLDARSKTLSRFMRDNAMQTPVSRVMRDHALHFTFDEARVAEESFNTLRQDTTLSSLFSFTLEHDHVVIRLVNAEEARIRNNSVSQAVEVLQQRLTRNDLLLDAKVQPHGSRQIVVQLPHTDDANYRRLKGIITQRAQLEFKAIKASGSTKEQLLDRYDGDLPQSLMILPGKPESGRVREYYLVDSLADLDGEHITRAGAVRNQNDPRPKVTFRLDAEGDRLFQELTRNNVNKRLGIIIDDVVYSAPVIKTEIIGGNVEVEGNFTWQAAHDLAHVLNSGSFQAPVKFEEERHIGASLGEDSIRRGLLSCLVGLALVFCFSVFFYRVAGFFAMIALAYNLFLILLLLSVFKATLTLPGIAGMVLTIGMAIDASILIFEKIKEEIAAGSAYRQALNDGFRGAMIVIFDSNFTTFGTGIILYYLGGPSIQGFAITLMLGILATLLAGVFFLKSIFEFFIDNTSIKRITF